jgi:hypothetical protein
MTEDQKEDETWTWPLGKPGPVASINGLRGLGELNKYFKNTFREPDKQLMINK